MKYQVRLWTVIIALSCIAQFSAAEQVADEKLDKAVPAGPRQVTTIEYLSYPPVFETEAKTLDPLDLARDSWKGYLTKQAEPWGMLPGLKPTLRIHFDSRALPWPVLGSHIVDCPLTSRNLGAHALLREMFGSEKKDDHIEEAHIGYLLSCTAPETGWAYCPEKLPRECMLWGDLPRNVILLYEQTGEEWLRDWAAKMLTTLREHTVLSHRDGIGTVAAFYKGNGGQAGIVVGQIPVTHTKDPTVGGWQHFLVGWNMWALSMWYELTGEKEALDFAVALANRLCNSEDPNGDDGAFRPDGSFGGKAQASSASWHMHGHTHCLPAMMHLGEQLIKAGRREKGLQLINQARCSFDWLYDPTRNPDAGSMTGWLGEWLMVATGWDRQADCEGCTVGDVVRTAAAFGAASRFDRSLESFVSYYDRAEQIFRGQLVEQTFRLTPRYLAVVKQFLSKRVDKDMPNASAEAKARELQKRYQEAIKTAERMVGQQLGACGFPDWANELPSDLDAELPGIHMQGCCADATIQAARAIWSETVTGDKREARVNLLFNMISPLVDVISCLPHRGEVNVIVKSAKKVLVRVPGWAPKQDVKVYVEKKLIKLTWDGEYVVFDKVQPGQQLTVTYPLRIAQVKETPGSLDGTEYTEKWRGNTIVDISPPGKWIPMFNRPELESEIVP